MWKNRKPNIVCNRRPNNKTIYWMIFCFYGHKAAFLCLLTTTWALHNSVLCTRENPIYFLSLSFRLKLDLRIMCNKSIKSENIINALAYPKTSISLTQHSYLSTPFTISKIIFTSTLYDIWNVCMHKWGNFAVSHISYLMCVKTTSFCLAVSISIGINFIVLLGLWIYWL